MSGILGFDPSLTSSGFAFKDEDEYHTGTIKPKNMKGSGRLRFVQDSFYEIIDTVYTLHGSVDLIVYEGYSMGTKNSKGRLYDIGELGGVLKLVAWGRGIDVLLVPPSNLKQYATGKGNADKPAVIDSIAANWGYNIKQNDEADAFVLLKMGEAYKSRKPPRQGTKFKALRSCSLLEGKK